MHKSFPHLLPSLIFAFLLFFIPSWNEVSAYSTDAETQAVILYVKPGANGTCSSWADACELQTALFNAVDGDQIWVAAGTYKPSSFNRSATFQLISGVAIYGGFPAAGGDLYQRNWVTNLTTLSGDIGVVGNTGDNSYHVVTGNGLDTTAVLDGFTISGGNANGYDWENNDRGGGMYNESSSPNLSNVTFNGNSAYYGGGMYNESSSPTLNDVTFSNNTITGDWGYGGGMCNGNSSPSLTNVTFSGNTSSYYGGGMSNQSNSSPSLTNVTFSGNTSSYYGGGMVNSGSSPSLINVTFSSNSATSGGGMVNAGSSPSLSNVTFSSNTAAYCGGMYNSSSSPNLTDVIFSNNTVTGDIPVGGGMCNGTNSSPSLTNVTFSGNSATGTVYAHGGGMFNYDDSSASLTNVTFSGNSASDNGGGMYNDGDSLSLSNVTFSSNSAMSGGGMYNYGDSPTLTNVTFSSNSAMSGGGMYNSSSSPSLTNITFYDNSAEYGGGMYNYSISNPSLTNSILWGNIPDQISGPATVTYSDVQGGYGGSGNINADPLLEALADNDGFTQTHALGEGSPAIDAGDPNNCPVIDQRGYIRPIDGDGDGTATCDMGAYEYASYPATFTLSLDIVGSGSITKDPDKSEYLWGEVVTLTPTADADWIFTGWSGDATGMDNPLQITITDDINVTTNFAYYLSDLTVSVFPELSGTVTISPDLPTYPTVSQITITAEPNPGWEFAGWTGDASGMENPLNFTILGDTEIVANFEPGEYTLSVNAYPASFGSVTIDPVQDTYHYGDQVLLTAVDSTDHVFANWSGDASGSVNPLLVTITGNMDITANFNCLLTVSVFPDGGGSVTFLPDQTSFPYGSQVTLTAVPNPGWTFIGWSGSATGLENPLTVTIKDNLVVTAHFSQIEYSLSVSVNPPGMGTVTKSPNKPNYYYGDVVTLTASSTVTGWRFIGWSGNSSGETNPLQVTITGNTDITANFSDQYTLSTIVEPPGSGTITRDINQDTYTYGTQVVLTATADPGWTFAGWSGDTTGTDNPLTITILGDTDITATFIQDEYTLAVTPSGSGTVAVEPVQATYHYGDAVILTPTADTGWTFFEWGSDASGTENPLTYTIVGNTSITATFTQDEYALIVTPVGSGTVAVEPVQATYHYGDVVTLTPTADPCWSFAGWGGDASGSDNPLTFTIQGNTNITALFTTNWIFLPMITR